MTDIISYEEFDCCPVCGSKHYTLGGEHREMLQMLPMKQEEISQQAVISFTPALCEECGLAFNRKGLSNSARAVIYKNYQFMKPSTGVGAANYVTYIEEVRKHLKGKDDAVLEIGGYDGYLLRELSKDGYTDLTLIDPSTQTDDDDAALQYIKSIKGYFPASDPVYQSRTDLSHKADSNSCGGCDQMRRYKLVAAKDVLQMIPDPMSFVRGMNNVMEIGGIAVLTSVPLHTMHSLQCVHLGINAYTYLAQVNGFTLIDTYKRPENGYVIYVLRKEVDLISEPEKAQEFAAKSQRTVEQIASEQELQRKLIHTNGQFGEKAAEALNEIVAKQYEAGNEIVIYGTGFYAFCILDSIKHDLSKLKLTLVNSSPEQDGLLFMLPDGATVPVHYSKKELANRHIPLLVLGIMSPLFKAEISDILNSINCTCDEILYLPEHDI